jgi:two-component system, cell cycle sensor histidine kinase and response regulator CckA
VFAPLRLPPLAWSGLALGATATATVLGVLLLPIIGPLAWVIALLPAAVAVGWASGVRVERALRVGDATRAAVLTAAPDAVVAVDRAGRVVEFNPAAERLFGCPRDRAVGRPAADVVGSALARALTTGAAGRRPEVAARRADGTEFLAELAVAKPASPVGPAAVGFVRDRTERDQAERALREGEARYRELVDQAADAMFLLGMDGRIVDLNRRAWECLGYGREELLGRSLGDLEADGRLAELSSSTTQTLDGLYRRKDGTTFPAEVRFGSLAVSGERLTLALVRDVSQRRRAEAALRQSEALFRLVWDSAADGMRLTDESGAVVRANAAYCELVGKSPAQVIGRPFTDVYAADGRDQILRRHRDRFAARSVEPHFESEIELWDGRRRWFEVDSAFVEAPGGSALLLGVMQDVTDRKRAEAALRERDDLLQGIISHIPVGVFWKDRNSAYLGCNDQVARDAGFDTPDQLIGRSDLEMFAERTEAEFYRACDRQVMDTAVPLLNIEEAQTRAEGKATLLTSKVPLRDAAGSVVGVLGVYQDITDRKRLEEQLRQAQKMEAVGQLAGGIAHDFNNLLTVINGFSQVTLDLLGRDDPARAMVDEIHSAGTRAASLTRQLLAFSRRQVLEPRVVDLNAVVGETERLLRRLIGEDVLLVTDLAPDLGRVRVDAGQMEQVLMNLAVNARDAMPRGGTLTIATRDETGPDGDVVHLLVTDTGCGMDPQTRARLFEPFFTTKEPGKGTGLGLAVVHGVVTQSGGRIEVESEPGKGTTFRIELPRAAGPEPGEGSVGPVDLPRGTETLLLVEDEAAVRALDRRVLASCGYTVLEAKDGRDAVRVADGHPGKIDLLVSDVVMPHLGGRQLAERLAAGRSGLKVLFVSGYTDDAVVRHGVGSEFAFLPKPFTPAGLARKVREVLDRA